MSEAQPQSTPATPKKPGAVKAGLKSPKTTTGAIMALASAILLQAQAQWDGDPATVPQWLSLVPVVLMAVSFFFARDADKTSKDSGAE